MNTQTKVIINVPVTHAHLVRKALGDAGVEFLIYYVWVLDLI